MKERNIRGRENEILMWHGVSVPRINIHVTYSSEESLDIQNIFTKDNVFTAVTCLLIP